MDAPFIGDVTDAKPQIQRLIPTAFDLCGRCGRPVLRQLNNTYLDLTCNPDSLFILSKQGVFFLLQCVGEQRQTLISVGRWADTSFTGLL